MYEIKYHTEDLSQYTFLVTGGAGFIGSNIVEYLLKYDPKKVRVLDNFSTGYRSNLEEFSNDPRLEIMEGDIRNLEICRKAMEGIDYVSHQAALGSVPRSINDPITTNEVNVSGFLNVLVAAKDAAVKRMVYASSSSVYGDSPDLPKVEEKIGNPLSPYAVSKRVNEIYAENFSKVYGFHTIGLRYFNVFGPKQSPEGPYAAVIPLFIKAALTGQQPVIFGDGNNSRDFTFVENVVQANVKALLKFDLKQNCLLNIATGDRKSINDIWKNIKSIIGVNLTSEYRKDRPGDIPHSNADVNNAKVKISYTPEINILDGLSITINRFSKSGLSQ